MHVCIVSHADVPTWYAVTTRYAVTTWYAVTALRCMRHYMLTSLNSWLLALRASLLHVLTERRSGLAAGLGAAAAGEVKEPQMKEPHRFSFCNSFEFTWAASAAAVVSRPAASPSYCSASTACAQAAGNLMLMTLHFWTLHNKLLYRTVSSSFPDTKTQISEQ